MQNLVTSCVQTSRKELKRWCTYKFLLESVLGGVGVRLHLLQLFLQGGFLSRASSQLRSQLALLLPELDVVIAQPVEAHLQLL